MSRSRIRAAVALAAALAVPAVLPTADAFAAVPIDLAISQYSHYLYVGNTGVVSLTVTNLGSAATTGTTTTVTDQLHPGLVLKSAAGSGWNCGATVGQAVRCSSSAAVPAGQKYPKILLTVMPTLAAEPEVEDNVARVSNPYDGNPANDVSTADIYVGNTTDLSIQKTHTGDFTAGQNGGFTITVTNDSGSTTAATTTVTDLLPASMTYVSATGTGWTCGVSEGTVTCTSTANIAQAGSFPPITLTVTPNLAGEVSNTVSVSNNGGGESDPADNTDTDTVTVLAGQDQPPAPQDPNFTTISTQASNGGATGSPISDTATVGGGANLTGTIVFRLYGPDDASCGNTPAFTSAPVAVNGAGGYQSPSFTPTLPGTYRWIATYSGDGNNAGAAGHCNDANESVVVTGSALPSPTSSPSPEPTGSPSPNPSPTTQPAPSTAARIVLSLSHQEITAGNKPYLRGLVTDSAGNPVAGQSVTLYEKTGDSEWHLLPANNTVVSDATGHFAVKVGPLVQTSYGAISGLLHSNVVNIRVHIRVDFTVSVALRQVTVTGHLLPMRADHPVGLREVLSPTLVRFLGGDLTDAGAGYSITSPALAPGSHLLQVYVSPTVTNLGGSHSFLVTIT